MIMPGNQLNPKSSIFNVYADLTEIKHKFLHLIAAKMRQEMGRVFQPVAGFDKYPFIRWKKRVENTKDSLVGWKVVPISCLQDANKKQEISLHISRTKGLHYTDKLVK